MTGTASRTIISGLLLGVQEGREDLQALDRAGLLLALAVLDLVLEVARARARGTMPGTSHGARFSPAARSASTCAASPSRSQLGLLAQQLADVLGAHAAAEVLAEAERRAEAVLELTEEGLVRDDQLGPELVLVDRLLDVGASGQSSPSAGGSSVGSSLLAKSFQTSLRRWRASS